MKQSAAAIIVCWSSLLAFAPHAFGQTREPLRPLMDWERRAPDEQSALPEPGNTPNDSAHPPATTGRRISADELRAALQRYAREPGVERVVQAALQHAPKTRADALASRARTAGWVPTVALRARRGQGVDLSHALAEDALDASTDDDLTLEAALTFQLDRVVFRSEEVALARQSQAEVDARAARARTVIALYFERRRLQLERDLGGSGNLERAVRIAELEALLDVFTNGAFGRMIAASRWKTAGSTPASRSPSPQSSTSVATP
jgi:hypothetical protein